MHRSRKLRQVEHLFTRRCAASALNRNAPKEEQTNVYIRVVAEQEGGGGSEGELTSGNVNKVSPKPCFNLLCIPNILGIPQERREFKSCF